MENTRGHSIEKYITPELDSISKLRRKPVERIALIAIVTTSSTAAVDDLDTVTSAAFSSGALEV
ncbi:hypothetical protein CRG98_029617 [Punica granatum]|uniref:Uncharacterized protein n=1 Tax=Punica granatum TaxID=22663 RepID=A0A2I0J2R9_PUNGR|nr:hypothetical protein CRG98_029617 [Punica granatum]